MLAKFSLSLFQHVLVHHFKSASLPLELPVYPAYRRLVGAELVRCHTVLHVASKIVQGHGHSLLKSNWFSDSCWFWFHSVSQQAHKLHK